MQSKIGCYIIAVAVITVWSTTFVSTKILLRSLSPEEIMFYRHVLAYLVLLAAYPHRHPSGGFREELLFAGAGIFGSTLYFLTENYALKYSMASNVGLLLATTPMLTAIVARFLTTGEPFNRQLAAGFCIAFLGVFLVIFNGHFILKLHPIGDFLAIAAALSWAFYSTLVKKSAIATTGSTSPVKSSFTLSSPCSRFSRSAISVTTFHASVSQVPTST